MDFITSISHLTAKQCVENDTGGSVTKGFEGIEKRLEIGLRKNPNSSVFHLNGMRNATKEFWVNVLNLLNAKILDVKSTETMDGYLLSESSLFVSPRSITLITCGTTKLLSCVSLLLEGIKQQGLEVEWVSYSRKNFMYPWVQPAPHCSLSAEYTLLRKHFPDGHPFILGPLDGDHYFFYLMDKMDRPCKEEVDQQLKILMFDLDPDVCRLHFCDEFSINSEQTQKVRRVAGLTQLFKDFPLIQDVQFAPCGYSVNALRGLEYSTIHVTPELECSYASFETTVSLKCYYEVIRSVLEIYKPGRFTIHLFLDEFSEAALQRNAGGSIGIENAYEGYRLVNYSINEFQPGYLTGAATFVGKANFVT